jgi:hypothetical protein
MFRTLAIAAVALTAISAAQSAPADVVHYQGDMMVLASAYGEICKDRPRAAPVLMGMAFLIEQFARMAPQVVPPDDQLKARAEASRLIQSD